MSSKIKIIYDSTRHYVSHVLVVGFRTALVPLSDLWNTNTLKENGLGVEWTPARYDLAERTNGSLVSAIMMMGLIKAFILIVKAGCS